MVCRIGDDFGKSKLVTLFSAGSGFVETTVAAAIQTWKDAEEGDCEREKRQVRVGQERKTEGVFEDVVPAICR